MSIDQAPQPFETPEVQLNPVTGYAPLAAGRFGGLAHLLAEPATHFGARTDAELAQVAQGEVTTVVLPEAHTENIAARDLDVARVALSNLTDIQLDRIANGDLTEIQPDLATSKNMTAWASHRAQMSLGYVPIPPEQHTGRHHLN